MAGTRLTRTPSADGNLDKFTISLWFKRCKLGSQQKFLFAGDSGSNQLQVLFHNDDQLQFEYYDGSYNYKIKTNRKFRDTSAWYHIVLAVDTTQATASDRVKIYVNGQEMIKYFNKVKPKKSVLVGDLNIAPYENDVWSHKQLLNVVSHTPIETEQLNKLIDASNWVDVGRKFIPKNEKLYSWWSYRNKDWKKSNRGRRLDHIWVSKDLDTILKSFLSCKEIRDWEKPSDHVPLILELSI